MDTRDAKFTNNSIVFGAKKNLKNYREPNTFIEFSLITRTTGTIQILGIRMIRNPIIMPLEQLRIL